MVFMRDKSVLLIFKEGVKGETSTILMTTPTLLHNHWKGIVPEKYDNYKRFLRHLWPNNGLTKPTS